MTFSEQIWYGLFKPSKYKEVLELKARRSVLYVVVLMLILGLVTFVMPTAAVIAGFGGMEKLFTETMSPMSYDGEELTIERPFRMAVEGSIFIIDTESYTVPDSKLEKDGAYIAVGSKNIRLTTVIGGQIWSDSTMPLNQVIGAGFNNQSLVSLIPAIYVSLFICYLIMCLGYFIKYAVFALILSIFINSVNKQMNIGLSFGQVFMLCFYGQSLGMVISNFNLAIGFIDPTIVSLVTMFVSIHFITSAVMLMNKSNQV